MTLITKTKSAASIIAIVGIFFLGIAFNGCKSMPRVIKDEPKPCFDYRMCAYYFEKNPTVCIDFAKECRAFRRYNKCKIEKMDFQKCWLYLNQK